MRGVAASLCGVMAMAAVVCSAQISHYVEIQLPDTVKSETVFIRYVLAGETLGGWVEPRAGVSSYFIGTTFGGRSATGIKALIYAPGCAIQTLDAPLSSSHDERFPFTCRPLNNVRINGRIVHADGLRGREMELTAKYVARWAQPFLGAGSDLLPVVPAGDAAYPASDGSFRISVPDFSRDLSNGEIQIWVKDKGTGALIAELIPAGPRTIKTRMGALKALSAYPPEIDFALCASTQSPLHNREGFALRSAIPENGCER